jgi:spermidine/putrescine transport system substrate-binding protein
MGKQMEKNMKIWLSLAVVSFCAFVQANEKVVNVYAWPQEVSLEIIEKFQKDTGIKVNFATFDSNEMLYAKMKASKGQYDIIEPSGYYISRMIREGMIQKIDLNALKNYQNIDPRFRHPDYDPAGEYSIPWVWGVTGIFVNRNYHPAKKIEKWSDLWSREYYDALLMLDDPREVFNIGLLTLDQSPNEQNADILAEAYKHLLKLLPNIRLYNNNSVASLIIDEDVTVGMAWNADVYKASRENPEIEFIYPKDKFVMWVDAFAIPSDAPHPENAYIFLNYILQAKIAAIQVQETYYAITNQAAKESLPKALLDNKILFPDDETLSRGIFQTDVNNEALETISRYWQLLKLQ